jgi:hypothetical protein
LPSSARVRAEEMSDDALHYRLADLGKIDTSVNSQVGSLVPDDQHLQISSPDCENSLRTYRDTTKFDSNYSHFHQIAEASWRNLVAHRAAVLHVSGLYLLSATQSHDEISGLA